MPATATNNNEKPSWVSFFFFCMPVTRSDKKVTDEASPNTNSAAESSINEDKESLELTIVYDEPTRQPQPSAEPEVSEPSLSPVAQKCPQNGEFLRNKFNSQLAKSLHQSKKAPLASFASSYPSPEAEDQSTSTASNPCLSPIHENDLSRASTATEETQETTIIQVGLVAEGPVSQEILGGIEDTCIRSSSVNKSLPALPKPLKKRKSLSQISHRLFPKTDNGRPRLAELTDLPQPIPAKKDLTQRVYDGRHFNYGSTVTVETLYVDDDRSFVSDWSLNSTVVAEEDRPARRGTLSKVCSSLASMRVSTRRQ